MIDYEKEIRKRRPDDWNGTLLNNNDFIQACDKHALAMVFTGIRHFRH